MDAKQKLEKLVARKVTGFSDIENALIISDQIVMDRDEAQQLLDYVYELEAKVSEYKNEWESACDRANINFELMQEERTYAQETHARHEQAQKQITRLKERLGTEFISKVRKEMLDTHAETFRRLAVIEKENQVIEELNRCPGLPLPIAQEGHYTLSNEDFDNLIKDLTKDEDDEEDFI